MNNEITHITPSVCVLYDLGYHPFSIGDVLVFCLAAKRLIENLSPQDKPYFLLVGNERSHGVAEVCGFGGRTSFFYNRVASVTPLLALIHQNIQVIFARDYSELNSKIRRIGRPLKVIWPTSEMIKKRVYSFYDSARFLVKTALTQRSVNPFVSGPVAKLAGFLIEYQRRSHARVVTVNLRKDPRVSLGRNSTIEIWNEFFKSVDGDGTLFVYLCSRTQLDEKILENNNVVWSGEFREDVSFDLSLMNDCDAHFGASSGLVGYFLYCANKRAQIFGSDIFDYKESYSGIYNFNSADLAFQTSATAPTIFFPRRESFNLIMEMYLRWRDS